MTFLRVRITFFHFKAHCWSGVWTENSEKNARCSLEKRLTIELLFVEFCRDRVFLDIFESSNCVFSTLKLTPGAGYERKILKKIPGVFLNSALPWRYFLLSFVECKSSNRVFYDIFESWNRVFSTLKLTAGAKYERKIQKKKEFQTFSQVLPTIESIFVEFRSGGLL